MSDALYLPDGDRFVPTVATTGPWDAGAQHGGPVAALLARAVERVPAPEPVQVVRLTVDLLRPVPLAPLEIRTEVTRPGKLVSVVEATLLADGTAVARVAALRIRVADLDLPDDVDPVDPPPGPPGSGELGLLLGPPGTFNDAGLEIRFVEGGFHDLGPGIAWTRLRLPVVAGEEPTPLQRAAAASDVGSGVSSVLPHRDWLYINPDLNIHLFRPPAGEWIGLRSTTFPTGAGAGLAESALYDATGRIGRSIQSLLLAPRP